MKVATSTESYNVTVFTAQKSSAVQEGFSAHLAD